MNVQELRGRDLDLQIRRLYADGMSCGQIAEELPGADLGLVQGVCADEDERYSRLAGGDAGDRRMDLLRDLRGLETRKLDFERILLRQRLHFTDANPIDATDPKQLEQEQSAVERYGRLVDVVGKIQDRISGLRAEYRKLHGDYRDTAPDQFGDFKVTINQMPADAGDVPGGEG